MSRGPVLTAEIKQRIRELADHGLTDREIAGALHISKDAVTKYKGEKKDVGKPENHHGFEQKTRKPARHRNTHGNQPQENRGEPGDHTTDSVPGGGTITFTGGKKHQKEGVETMNKEKQENFEWECPKCGHQFNGSPDKCPKCGVELQE